MWEGNIKVSLLKTLPLLLPPLLVSEASPIPAGSRKAGMSRPWATAGVSVEACCGVTGSKSSPLPNNDPILNCLNPRNLLIKNELLQPQFLLLFGQPTEAVSNVYLLSLIHI